MTTKAKTTKDYDEARERAAEAKAELDRIEAELEADRRADQERRAERGQEWDERFLSDYGNGEGLMAEEREAWDDFYAAIQDGPVWGALARAWAARDVRIARSSRARGIAETLGRSQLPAEVQFRQRDLVSAISEGLRRAAERLVREDEERLDAERQAAEGRSRR